MSNVVRIDQPLFDVWGEVEVALRKAEHSGNIEDHRAADAVWQKWLATFLKYERFAGSETNG